jgi:hypothetical protein
MKRAFDVHVSPDGREKNPTTTRNEKDPPVVKLHFGK